MAGFLGDGFLGGSGASGGSRGKPGKNGSTPTIGSNGNWFINGVDTGVSASGKSGTKTYTLTADEISKALDHGQYNGSGSIKSLDDGWWIIPVSNKNATGRPPVTTSDIIYFQQTTTPDAGKRFGIGMAFGKDSNLKDSVWVQYKSSGVWTSWIKEGGTYDLTSITSQIDELKRGNQAVLDELSKIQTAAGELFAPTKYLFDKEANALIDSKLDFVKHTQTVHSLSIVANTAKNKEQDKSINDIKSGELTIQQVESALKAKGWGPNPIPHPEGTVIHFGVGNDFPTDFSSQLGEKSNSEVIEITGLDLSSKKIWIAVPKDKSSKVIGITVNGGLPASWESRSVTISGEPWTIYISPSAMHAAKINVQVQWSK